MPNTENYNSCENCAYSEKISECVFECKENFFNQIIVMYFSSCQKFKQKKDDEN